ncbi:MAG: hypothetical protein ISS36_02060 [Candidatus Aenigmarchaeota archaeon]|nr:hypothetical protein [Candidatus Aenigmarchaeota archaeon]
MRILVVLILMAVVLTSGCISESTNSTIGNRTGVNCPDNNCTLLGSSCGTVTPGYNDECCANRNKDTIHVQCLGNWKYIAKDNACAWICDFTE